MNKDFVDVIYLFVSPDGPGIEFYDNSPTGAVVKFAGSLPSGVFETVKS